MVRPSLQKVFKIGDAYTLMVNGLFPAEGCFSRFWKELKLSSVADECGLSFIYDASEILQSWAVARHGYVKSSWRQMFMTNQLLLNVPWHLREIILSLV